MRLRAGAAVLLLLSAAPPAAAQRMPVTTFTSVHGLSHEYVFDVLTDSRGFVWLATQDGVSRFDGARFTNYMRQDGLPDRATNTILETRDGTIWIATNGGGAGRFEPRGITGAAGRRVFFTTLPVGTDRRTNRVNRLAEDDAGGLWAATEGGLFRRTAASGVFERVPLATLGLPDDLYIEDLVVGQGGELWMATAVGLVRRLADGRGATYAASADPGRPFVRRVLTDSQNRVWAASTGGLFVLARPAVGAMLPAPPGTPAPCPLTAPATVSLPTDPGSGCRLGPEHGLASDRVHAFGFGRDGRLILGHAQGGLTEIVSDRLSVIEPAQQEFDVTSLAFDMAGNMWIGTQAGAKRVLRGGFVAYSTYDGLRTHSVRQVQLGPDRTVIAQTSDYTLHWFHDGHLRQVRLPLPASVPRPSWAGAADYLAPSGDWWAPTARGLYRFGGVDRLEQLAAAQPLARYTTRDGLANDEIAQLFMDSRGDLWVGHASTGGPALSRLRRGASRFEVVPITGVSPVTTVVSFVEDRAGQVWLSLRDGGLARLRGGRMEAVPGAPSQPGRGLFTDSRGRLWVCSADGLLRVVDPTSPAVTVQRVGPDDGLDRQAQAVVEDLGGTLFLSTFNGVVQIDPDARTVRHYTVADGLPSSNVTTSVRDGRGDLWFGTARGLAHLRPSDLARLPPGPARISGVEAGQRRAMVSEFGDLEVSDLVVEPDENHLRVEFFAMGGGVLPTQYQYRLSDREPWTRPSDSRSVELAGLSSGAYRLEVRAVDPATGSVVPGTAAVNFRVLPPIWQRWWFLAALLVLAAGAAYGVHRSRLAGAVRMERVRARIATDLHDDIGSSLSQIAILSEVSRQRMRHDPATAQEPLGLIAETSRELVDKMSDIVWAVNPRRDSLSDLVYRMRRFADDTLAASDVRFRFSAPDTEQPLKLGPDVRRELLLILKESVTNIARHSRATEASVDLQVEGSRLRLEIRDNGTGFDPAGAFDGNGVLSMRNRVQALGGTLRIDSAPGAGTIVHMEIAS